MRSMFDKRRAVFQHQTVLPGRGRYDNFVGLYIYLPCVITLCEFQAFLLRPEEKSKRNFKNKNFSTCNLRNP